MTQSSRDSDMLLKTLEAEIKAIVKKALDDGLHNIEIRHAINAATWGLDNHDVVEAAKSLVADGVDLTDTRTVERILRQKFHHRKQSTFQKFVRDVTSAASHQLSAEHTERPG